MAEVGRAHSGAVVQSPIKSLVPSSARNTVVTTAGLVVVDSVLEECFIFRDSAAAYALFFADSIFPPASRLASMGAKGSVCSNSPPQSRNASQELFSVRNIRCNSHIQPHLP